jgi:hypothetical protein
MSINLIGRKISFGGDDFDSTAIADQSGEFNSTVPATVMADLPAEPTATTHNETMAPSTPPSLSNSTDVVAGSLTINNGSAAATGTITSDTTSELYSVSLTGGQTYTFSAAITSGVSGDYLGGAAIDLRASNITTRISSTITNNDGDSVAPTFTFTPASSGIYYFAISAGSSEFGSSNFLGFQYSVSVLQGNTSPGSNVVDAFVPYTDKTPGTPTAADVVAAAMQYVGKQWAWDNCTGLAWAVGTEVDPSGGGFYETISSVTAGLSNAIPSVIPDPDSGYVTPTPGKSGNWTTYQTGSWQSFVQIGDIVRIPGSQLLAEPAGHSFIVVGKSASGEWEVIDNTDPMHQSGLPNSDHPITIAQPHTFDYSTNTLYQQILNATSAYVSRLNASSHITPSVSAQNLSVPEGQSTGLSASVSNPSGDGITQYWVEDLGGGSGHLSVGGTSEADGQWFMASSNWSNVQYVGGASPGSDSLELAIYDSTTGSFVYSSTFTAATSSPSSAVANDFNGDGYGDILLQSAGGQIEYANMANGSFQNIVSVTTMPGWNVVGQGNISGGADSDIVIQNGSQMYYVDLVNGAFSQFVSIGNPTGYVVVGVGDIADDHFADVVIQNPTTDEVGYANMNNGVFNNWFSVADPVGWKAVAVADINDDGHADIVIQNKTTGEVGYANMSSGTLHGFVSLGEPVGYNVVGAGDVNGLGDADVVVQNPTNGSIGYANMINGAVSGWFSIGDPAGWSVIAVEDILGNGFDDIVIENNSTDQIAYANMTGGSFQGWVGITTVPGFVGKTGPGSSSAASSAPELPTSNAGTQTSVQTDDLAAANSAAFAGQDAVASNGGTVNGITMQDPGPQIGFAVNDITMQDPGPQNGGTVSGITVQDPGPQNGGTVSGITMQDPGPQNGGTVNGITMQDPGPQDGFAVGGIAMQDLGPQNGGAVNGITMQDPGPQDGFAVSGITMQDPGPQNGGAVSSMFDPTAAYGGLLSAVSVLDPATTSAGAVTGSGPNDQGSASWLTDGALPGGTSVGDNQDLNSSSTAFVVTADSLQHALKPGT